jgi:hypothetical protein
MYIEDNLGKTHVYSVDFFDASLFMPPISVLNRENDMAELEKT